MLKATHLLTLIAVAGSLAACGGSQSEGRVVTTDTKIERLDPNPFVVKTTDFKPDSDKYLGALAETLAGNPDIRVVKIVCHADPADVDLATAANRATAIRDRLVALSVAGERLTTAEGEERPGGDQCDFIIELRDNE